MTGSSGGRAALSVEPDVTTDGGILSEASAVIERAGRVRWRRLAPDLLIVGALVVVALLVRRHGLPTDGLWLDDAQDAAGLKASPSQLPTVGLDHPGYIALLMGWSRLTGGTATSLAYPSLIAGALGPGLLYVVLRRLGYARSIGALLGAVLVTSETDIVYSGRVKNYTIDLLIVLILVLVVPRLADRAWRWQTGALWVISAIVVASFSGFTLAATVAAGLVLIAHRGPDIRIRVVAVVLQVGVSGALLLASNSTYNLQPINRDWRQTWDGFLSFSANPIHLGDQVVRHLGRVAQVFPGGPGWFTTLSAVVAVAALAAAATRRRAFMARYLLLLLAIALVGGFLGRFPFGPKVGSQVSNGTRVSLWLIPVIVIGLAMALQRVRTLTPSHMHLRRGLDGIAFLAAGIILVTALGKNEQPYPYPGASSGTHFVESHLTTQDAVLLPWPGQYSFTAASNYTATIQARPTYAPGFWPEFADQRLHLTGTGIRTGQVVQAVRSADRVFIYIPDPWNRVERRSRATYTSALTSLGFRSQGTSRFGVVSVDVWRRDQGINLRSSDVPRGWQVTTAPSNPFPPALFACLGVPNLDKPTGSVTASSPDTKTQLTATSTASTWPTTTAAQGAYAALAGPSGAGCVQSATQAGLRAAGYATSVTATEVAPPSAPGNSIVAYAEVVRTPDERAELFNGSTVFLTHGRTSAIVSCVSPNQRPFPPNTCSSLVTAVAGRAASSP